ncbi:hypothetical protein GmHk_09G026727 [Glycine max]|nr:hypothetical protein GmHk_09G026727 [Glycine max]
MSTKFSTIRVLIIYTSILISSSFYIKCFLWTLTNLPPSSSCYRPSLPIQMRDMDHDDEEEDDDNNNTNNNDDDDDNGADYVPQ